MKEAQFQTKVSRYLKNEAWGNFAYELKVTAGKTLPFSKFQPQQLPALNKAKHGILHHKLTDASLGAKPFDGFVFTSMEVLYKRIMRSVKMNIKKQGWQEDISEIVLSILVSEFKKISQAYVGILFYKDDKEKAVNYFIDIDKVLVLKLRGEKSISLEYCKEHGFSLNV